MASRIEKVHLMSQENAIVGKKNEQIRNIVPKRRPALGDVSNKIGNQTTCQPNINKKTCDNTSKPAEATSRCLKRVDSLLSFSTKQLNIYDPDENTKNDPNAVNEYLADIFSYLKEMEKKLEIHKDYLKDHQITPSMRAVLINWIVDVHVNFKVCIETLHHSVSIIDRYLQVKKDVGKDTLQLVGTTAVLIASKYEEVFSPPVSDFVYITDNTFSETQILAMERDILHTLNFTLGRPSSIHFLRRYSKIARVNAMQHNLGKYLLELALLDYNICHIPPSHQAAAACCLSIAILKEEMDLSKVWSATLVHYTEYKLSDFRYVMALFSRMLLRVENSKNQSVTRKYAAASFGKISTRFGLRGNLVKKLAAEVPVKK